MCKFGEHVACCHVVDDEGGVFQGVDADQLPILIVEDELESALLDVSWLFHVPPEAQVDAVSPCCMQTTVAPAGGTGVLRNEMPYGPPHVDPRACQGTVDELNLALQVLSFPECSSGVVYFLCGFGGGKVAVA